MLLRSSAAGCLYFESRLLSGHVCQWPKCTDELTCQRSLSHVPTKSTDKRHVGSFWEWVSGCHADGGVWRQEEGRGRTMSGSAEDRVERKSLSCARCAPLPERESPSCAGWHLALERKSPRCSCCAPPPERKTRSCARCVPLPERESPSCAGLRPVTERVLPSCDLVGSHNSGFSFPPSAPTAHNLGFSFPGPGAAPHSSGFSFPEHRIGPIWSDKGSSRPHPSARKPKCPRPRSLQSDPDTYAIGMLYESAAPSASMRAWERTSSSSSPHPNTYTWTFCPYLMSA